MNFVILSLFILFTKALGQEMLTEGECDKDSINACLSPIKYDIPDFFVEKTDDWTLTLKCLRLDSAENCVYEYSGNCFKFELVDQLSLIDATTYLCSSEGKTGLRGLQLCLDDQRYAQNLNECIVKIEPLIESTDYNVTGSFCKSYNVLYSCYVNASKICNSETFARSISTKRFSKHLKDFGCSLDFDTWETQVYSSCNLFKLDSCLVWWNNSDILQFKNNQYNLSFLAITPKQFNNSCSAIDGLINCVTTNAKCDETILYAHSFLEIARAFDYLCKTDRSGYNKLSACYVKNPSMFSSCTQLPSDCSSFKLLQKCISDSSKITCGDSYTVDNYFYLNFHGIFERVFDCILTKPSNPTVTNAPSIKPLSVTNAQTLKLSTLTKVLSSQLSTAISVSSLGPSTYTRVLPSIDSAAVRDVIGKIKLIFFISLFYILMHYA